MDTRKIATEYRLAKRAELIQAKQDNGQNVEEFCLSEGISKNTYFYWQRKLRESACTQLAGQVSEAGREMAPEGWARLVPANPSLATKEIAIEIGGCIVRATAETEPELLASVCRTLKTLC